MHQLGAEAKRQEHCDAKGNRHPHDDPAQVLEVIEKRFDRLTLFAFTKLEYPRNFHGMICFAESRAYKARVLAALITLSAIIERMSSKLNSLHSMIDSLSSGFRQNPVEWP